MNKKLIDLNKIVAIIIGTLLLAIAANSIFLPNRLLSAGLTGISMLLHFLFEWRISLLVLVLNIPLFIIGYFYLDKRFLFYALLGMSSLSFWVEITGGIVIPTTDTLSVILVGGVIHGMGTGILFRGNVSTGGMDIIAKIINQHFSISMATVNFVLNSIILSLSMYYYGLDITIVTIATMFVSSQVANFMVDGLNHKRTLFIISSKEKYKEVSEGLINELGRGVTVMAAKGAYTDEEKYFLYSTISISEVSKAKQIVLKHDSGAFMTISDTCQVIGNGKGFIHPEITKVT